MVWRSIAAGFCIVLLGVFANRGMAGDGTRLSIVSWGGAYADSQRHAYFDPYQKLNPTLQIQLTNAGGDAVQRLREQAKIGAISWDIVDVTAADAIRLCKDGIAMPIEHDKILAAAPDGTPASQDFGQTMVSECMIPEIVYSTTFGYRIDKLPAKPSSLCDVFDLAKFPGKRSLEKRPINNLEWALVCDGVAPEKIYEVLESKDGVERALRKPSCASPPIPSGWPIRRVTSPMARPGAHRPRWSASTPNSGSKWGRTCRPPPRTPRPPSSTTMTGGRPIATNSTSGSRSGWARNWCNSSRRLG